MDYLSSDFIDVKKVLSSATTYHIPCMIQNTIQSLECLCGFSPLFAWKIPEICGPFRRQC
jgi:hypothetical protein